MKKLFLLLLISITAQGQIDRVEPPFWWSDMTHSSVQILFYGKNIANFDVAASNGIVIENSHKTENPNYLFVTIATANCKPQEITFSFSKDRKEAFSQKYQIKARRENSKFRKSYDSSDVVYLVMSDRFSNGNPKNDTDPTVSEIANRDNPSGRHGGDIQGIINHLDYIKELGATTLWPTPMCEDNDKIYSYHTYGQSDVYKIDPRFGTNDDYIKLASELHSRNMKLVQDYVTNHWGSEHWMLKDLPCYDWLHQFPGFAQTNYQMTTQFDTHTSQIDAKNCQEGWFVKSMPDLNQSNPLVLNYLIQNAIWWIENANLDGFRVDTYSYNDKEGISKWTKAITDEYPNFNIVGEVWMHNQAQMAYWQKDSKIGAIESYNSYLPSVMDFTLQDALSSVFNENTPNWGQGMMKVYENFTNDFLYPNPNNILTFVENHDTNRFNEIYKNNLKKYKMAMTLLATVRGIPQLYYGSEIGMAGDKGKGDAAIRKDFPGGWVGDSADAFTNSGRTASQREFFDFTSKLFTWRKSKSIVHSGKMTHYIPENNLYVYFRYSDTESVMVILNNSNEKQELNTNRFHENTKNYRLATDVLSGKIFDLKNPISIEGNSVLLLELKN